MTDQRNRVTTDPGLGPIELEHPSTLRSVAAADQIAEQEETGSGAPVYYEPKPLVAASEHKTLELETVKLSKDIDPRKLPTELTLRRPVLQIVPASDPSWPASASQYDSGWPPPETVLTTSQPPPAARRRSLLPLVLLALLVASLLLALVVSAGHRSAVPTITAQAATLTAARSLKEVEARPSPATPASMSRESTSQASASAPSGSSEAEPLGSATAVAPNPSAASARLANTPHHLAFKPVPASGAAAVANSSAPSAPPAAKQKRAIY